MLPSRVLLFAAFSSSCSIIALSWKLPKLSILPFSLPQTIRSISTTTASLLIVSSTLNNLPASADDAQVYMNSLATVIETKAILKPVMQYVKDQAYDNARTNIKLRLQKAMDSLVGTSVDFSEDADAIDAAADASTRVANTATQLDSTVYTLIFIPTEDGVPPPSAAKYVKQSQDFYSSLEGDLDVMLKVATEKQLVDAQALAAKELKEAPAFLFKEVTKKTGI